MSRELSVAEKKLLTSKVPKALGQGRKSYETKIETNDVLQKAGYKPYFDVDLPTDHKDKKAKLNVPAIATGTSCGVIVAKAALKSTKDVKKDIKPSNETKVCYATTAQCTTIDKIVAIITFVYILCYRIYALLRFRQGRC
jgi:hypothetical protein